MGMQAKNPVSDISTQDNSGELEDVNYASVFNNLLPIILIIHKKLESQKISTCIR